MNTKQRKLVPKSKDYGASCVMYKSSELGSYTPLATPTKITSGNGIQLTESEGHPRNPKTGIREGGPFFTEKFEDDISAGHFSCNITRKNSKGVVVEGIKASSAPILFPKTAMEAFSAVSIPKRPKDTSDLDPVGATAISRCSPVNPASEVGTGVSELYREGLPALPGIQTWQKRTALAKAAGSEYLNKVFGWDPLVGEVKGFSSTVRKQRDVMNQYHRDAGRNVRRSFRYPIEKTESTIQEFTGINTVCGVSATLFGERPPGKITITSGSTVRKWFEGAFTYDVPSQSDSWRRALGYGSQADVVYGASLNPSLLWNLTPWSWAVDWFSNTGDVINNISNYVRAGQVLRYGFVMEEKTSYVEMSMASSAWSKVPAPKSIRKYRTTKVRRAANPFGFGVSFSDMSTEQVLIAAALGITLL